MIKAIISSERQIVIPPVIRERLQLTAGIEALMAERRADIARDNALIDEREAEVAHKNARINKGR